MKTEPTSLLVLVFVASLAAQTPRPFVPVSVPSSFAIEPAVASDGDLTALCWFDGVRGAVFVSTSDGRGLAWSSPVQIDADPGNAPKATEVWGIEVIGQSIYVAWRDERFGNSNDEIFLNFSNDGGRTWHGEVRVDKGYPPGVGGVRDWRMAVSPRTPANHIYFAMASDTAVAADEDLLFAASHDGGATFRPTIRPSTLAAGSADVDDLDLVASGSSVYLVWRDDRFGSDDEVFLQRSANGGTGWLQADLLLSVAADGWDADDEVAVAVDGNVVAVAMQQDQACCNVEELRARVSLDGGASFGPSVKVGNYSTNVDDADMTPGALAVLANGNIVLAWSDDRAGTVPDENEVYVSVSTNGGLTWAADHRVSVNNGGAPKVAGRGGRVALVWSDGAGTINNVGAALSTAGGVTWKPSVFLPKPAGQDIDDPHVAYNALYGNFVCGWLAGNLYNEVYAGGFRPQSLRPIGWVPGPTTISFAFSDFQPNVSSGWAILAFTPGSLPLPGDGRNVGLAVDSLLLTALTLAGQGVFSSPLSTGGSGATPPVPVTLPPGITLHCVGVGINLATLSFGDITDVVPVHL